jgi:hypothetical protein
MNIYPLTQENEDQEWIIMQEILKIMSTNNKSHTRNKNINLPPISHMIHKRQIGSPSHTAIQTQELFRNTNIKIVYKTTNTIKYHLKSRDKTLDIHSLSVVYQLKCNESPLIYVGQTGCTFKVRYKEHVQAIRTNRQNSKFAEHMLYTDTHTVQ